MHSFLSLILKVREEAILLFILKNLTVKLTKVTLKTFCYNAVTHSILKKYSTDCNSELDAIIIL